MIFFKNKFQTTLALLAMMISCAPIEISAFFNADQASNGLSSTGNSITIWSVYDNVNASYVIRARTWDAINGWSANTTISTVPGMSFNPLLAVNDSGDAVAVWTTLDANHLPCLQGIIYTGGAWDLSPTQFTVTDEALISYELKLNDNGDIYIVWSSYPPSSSNSAIYALSGSSVTEGWNVPAGITQISDEE